MTLANRERGMVLRVKLSITVINKMGKGQLGGQMRSHDPYCDTSKDLLGQISRHFEEGSSLRAN